MLMVNKLSVLPTGQNSDAGLVASMVMMGGLKRAYKSDFKPFIDIFSPKNLTLTVVKAAIIPANNVVNEFNIYAIAQQQKADDEEIEEFDWDASYKKHLPDFFPNLRRVVSITVIKKSLEEYAYRNFSDRLVDRLTKDVNKSIIRKCHKFNRFVACQKIVHTAFWGNMLFNVSCFVYDVVNKLWIEMTDNVAASKPLQERIVGNVAFVLKKSIYYSLCLGSSAVGHAVGTYFSVEYGGAVGAFTFELIAGLSCSSIMNI